MPIEVIMPKVDMDMETGKIGLWHVAEGDRVAKGALIFEIETAKAAMEVESPGAGTIHHLLAAGETDVAIGRPVAWIYADGETVGPRPDSKAPVEAVAAVEKSVAVAPAEHLASSTGIRATPFARRLARDNNVALASVTGTGHRGRVSRADVEVTLSGDNQGPAASHSVMSTGSGEATPLFFIHGFANDASGWLPLLKHLPKDRKIHRLELPSHGRSPHLPVADFTDLATYIAQVFAQLKLHKVHLIGHSLGGALAIALANRYPANIASLTLIAPAGLGPGIATETLSGLTSAADAEHLAPWLKRLMASPELVDRAYVDAVLTLRSDPALRQAQIEMAKVLFADGVQLFDLTAEMQRLLLPVRVIWGRQDTIIPMAHALNLPGRIAINLLDGAGHLPHIEQPALTALIIREVVASADLGNP